MIVVSYAEVGTNWQLAVSDDGIGIPHGGAEKIVPGLGTSIVEALAKQLDARVAISMTPQGTRVTLTHGMFESVRTALDTAAASQH